jgi:uncharacterized repeat protein (TIGR01451 family)
MKRKRRGRAVVTRTIVAAALALLSLVSVGTASAAPGDILRTINVTPAPACGVSLGVAFDGAELMTSCTGDSNITRVDRANGNVLGTIAIAGVIDGTIDAISWDAKNNLLWLADSSHNVYSAVLNKTLGTGLATFRFQHMLGGFSFTDGLAFDGTDDSIWFSPDVSPTIYHYTQAGVLLGTRSGVLGNCNNSGLVVADATTLYMANNGCGEIWKGDKAGTTTTFFASLSGKRVEDLECDNTTFAPKSAIWSKDAFDFELNAFEVTAGQCAQGGVVNPPPHRATADVAIVKEGPATIRRGFHIIYRLTITNNGPRTAESVMVSDTLPPGLIGPLAFTSKGTCTVGATITCDLGALTNGETETVRIVAKVGPHAGPILMNTATVSSSTTDPLTANNSSTATTVVVP